MPHNEETVTDSAAILSLALFQPDIPQNVGSLMRTCACLGVPLHVIEPAGFVFDDKKLRRAGMDYADQAVMVRHSSWTAFQTARTGSNTTSRLVLLTTKGGSDLTSFDFSAGDTLLLGRESAGVPEDVHSAADARICLPMRPGVRSMNVAVAGAIAVFEALRRLQALPGSETMPTNFGESET